MHLELDVHSWVVQYTWHYGYKADIFTLISSYATNFYYQIYWYFGLRPQTRPLNANDETSIIRCCATHQHLSQNIDVIWALLASFKLYPQSKIWFFSNWFTSIRSQLKCIKFELKQFSARAVKSRHLWCVIHQKLAASTWRNLSNSSRSSAHS